MGWGYGDAIIWTYGRSGAMPLRVVSDTDDELVVWQPRGMVALQAVPADGRAQRDRPVDEMFTCEMVFALNTWVGEGTLRIARPGAAHSSWLFRAPDLSGTYLGWYGNLEAPLRRSDVGVHTRDYMLDVFMDAAGNVHWKDEHELAAAVRVGRVTEEQAAAVRAEGERVFAAMQNREYPYDGSWLDWQPDPSWDLPALPEQFTALVGQPAYELFPE
jgi:hypothetical protein